MGRGWRPILIGSGVVAVVFVVAQARPFEPEAPSGAPVAGDAARGETVFAERCASCHGEGGGGGSPGPRLVGSGLDAAAVAAVVERGRGVMPAGIVSGSDRDDVATYVASIASG
ncbi:MAG TPA: cytochrome c [Gaiellaceae bacterium]|jgi:mono/diheme cytochrome c family protein|nr:cytochrome c [Gaiellaceae bacterium]